MLDSYILAKNNSKLQGLIMCSTPLQMLIASNVIDLNPQVEFNLVVVTSVSNNKYEYYYEKLSAKCKNSFFFINKSGLKNFFNFKKYLVDNKMNKPYSQLYLASIDIRMFQYLVSKNSKAEVYTFDDGAVNILPGSLYHSKTNSNLLREVAWKALGVNHTKEDIIKRSQLHYTIYNTNFNLINNLRYIQLLENTQKSTNQTSKLVKIFLGQPLEVVSEKYDASYISNVIEDLNIDLYYPHPKEKLTPQGNFKTISSDLIFEDYLTTYLGKNPDTEVEVYSFTSSCILNIAGINNVKTSYVHDPYLKNRFKDLYSFALEELAIPSINIIN